MIAIGGNRCKQLEFIGFKGGSVSENKKKRSRSRQVCVLATAMKTEDAITESRVEFSNKKGEKLVGMYTDSGSEDVVILCHGYMSNKNMAQFPSVAKALGEAGFDVLRFDHPCAFKGESERIGPFEMGNHDSEVEDIACAVQFVRSRLGKRAFCILGHSKGGTNVMQYIATIGDVPNVINLAGRFKVREGTLKRFGNDIFEKLEKAGPQGILRKEASGFEWTMTLKDFERRSNRPMEEYAKSSRKKNTNLLCLHGRNDTTIPWQESELCADLSKGKCVVIEGDHNFNGPNAKNQMVDEVVKFCVESRKS